MPAEEHFTLLEKQSRLNRIKDFYFLLYSYEKQKDLGQKHTIFFGSEMPLDSTEACLSCQSHTHTSWDVKLAQTICELFGSSFLFHHAINRQSACSFILARQRKQTTLYSAIIAAMLATLHHKEFIITFVSCL